jgi:gamma-glutamyltranspeptidase
MEDGRVALECGMDPAVGEGLRRRGHVLWEEAPAVIFGGAQMVQRREGGYRAGSDRRKDGLAQGVPV